MTDKKRTISEVQNEYSGLAARAGHLEYGIKTNKIDLEIIYKQMRDLNLEAASISAEEKEAKASESASA